MSQPIPMRVVRHKCPHCARSYSRPGRAREHIARCWHNPAARGCKTCAHFEQDPGDAGIGWAGGEFCDAGVSLTGGDEVRPGPIVGCELWEADA